MVRANQDIREMAKAKGVFFWQIAERYGVNDVNFTKKMRKELSLSEKRKIINIIDYLWAKKEE